MQRKDIPSPPISYFNVFSICYVCFVISKLDMKRYLKKDEDIKPMDFENHVMISFLFPCLWSCSKVSYKPTTLLPWPTAFCAMHAATYRICNQRNLCYAQNKC